MFKHILLPTDGSPQSQAAVVMALQFAKTLGAKVTGLYVGQPFHVLTLQPEMVEDTRETYARDSERQADRYLTEIQQAASDVGVPCSTEYQVDEHPFEAIIKTAEAKGCDLIAMASHGRSGLKGILIGSVTQKVLTHTTLPVLVFR